MQTSVRVSLALIFSTLTLGLSSAFADKGGDGKGRSCQPEGSYSYLYNGTSYTTAGPVPLTEAGVFTVNRSNDWSGEGTLAFEFSNFGGQGPVWLLLHEVQADGVLTPDTNSPCTGIMEFNATATVVKTSNSTLVPLGTVLFKDAPRSISYTVSGAQNEIVDMISMSPGTIASGTAHRQRN